MYASNLDASMCRAVFFIDADQDAGHAFNDDRVFKWAGIPAAQTCGFDQFDRLGASFLACAGDQHITFHTRIIEQMVVANILERGADLRILADNLLCFLRGRASGGHLHGGDFWRHKRHGHIHEDFAFEFPFDGFQCIAMSGIRNG